MSQIIVSGSSGPIAGVIKEIVPNIGPDVVPDLLGIIAAGGGNNISTDGTVPNILRINVSGTTDKAVQVGNATGSLTSLAVGTNGQLLCGATGASPAFTTLTSTGSTVAFTTGANTLNLETGATVATQYLTDDTNHATPAAGVLTVAGGTNIGSTSAGSTVTLNLDADLTAISSLTASNGGSLRTGTTAADTLLLQAYDNDTGPGYTTFATLTAGNAPTMDLSDSVTKAGNYIYRAGGTDISVTDGGTGVSTLTDHGILLGHGTGSVTSQVLTDGQLLIGSTGADPVAATLTAGANITITPGAGTISISSTASGGFTWYVSTVDVPVWVANTGIIANRAATLIATLPANPSVGEVIAITGMNNSAGWHISQAANQVIHFGEMDTSVGIGGYLESTQIRDSVNLVCVVGGASCQWNVVNSIGNITVV